MIPTRVHALADYAAPALVAALSRRPGREPAPRRITRIGPVWHVAYTVTTTAGRTTGTGRSVIGGPGPSPPARARRPTRVGA